jgi:hypothetical protein
MDVVHNVLVNEWERVSQGGSARRPAHEKNLSFFLISPADPQYNKDSDLDTSWTSKQRRYIHKNTTGP